MSPRLRGIIDADEPEEPRQLGFFGGETEPFETAAGGLETAEQREMLVRQTKTVLLMRLLPQLGENKHSSARWRLYDYSVLQLRAICYVVDKMGPIDEGVTTGTVLERIADWAGEMAPGQPREEHDEVARDVVNWLLGMGGPESFEPSYVAYGDAGAVEWRKMPSIRFLQPRARPGKGVYLRASVEAINLLLGVLAEDIADAQKSAERVWQEHLKEKRYERACYQADSARLRSIQYAQDVREWIFRAKQDITGLGMAALQARYREALAHVGQRIDTENDMKRIIAENVAEEEPTPATERQLARIRRLLDDCFQRHTLLEGELLEATETISREGRRQLFAPPAAVRLSLSGGFQIALELPFAEAPRLSVLFDSMAGPVPPGAVDFWELAVALAAPPRNTSLQFPDAERPDLLDGAPRSRFPQEALFAAYAALETCVDSPALLSELLDRARRLAPGCPTLAAEALRIIALRLFAPNKKDELLFDPTLISERAGLRLADLDYYGDELLAGREDAVLERLARGGRPEPGAGASRLVPKEVSRC